MISACTSSSESGSRERALHEKYQSRQHEEKEEQVQERNRPGAQRQIRERQAIPDEYYVLREEIKRVDGDIQDLRRRLQEAEQRVDWLETLLRARSDWERMMAEGFQLLGSGFADD